MSDLKAKCSTITEALLELEGSSQYGARFVSRSGEATFYPYGEVLRRAKSVAGTLQSRGLLPGDRIAIVLPTSISFLDVFLGAQLAGGIPSALYPPFRLGKLNEYFRRTERMLNRIGARFLVTDRRVKKLLGPAIQNVPSLEGILGAEKLLGQSPWSPVDVDPESPAFLQFSSGSTAEPKAVRVSHRNLLYNLEIMNGFFDSFDDEEARQSGGVCWLPLYHDMGLVGCLFIGLYHPGTVTYIGPDTFISKPRIWLQTLSRYKAVISPAPDFAYGLCLSKIKDEEMAGVDLSHWKIAFNGAEPINTDVMRRFSERFSRWGFQKTTMTPVYGLAEAVLAVSFSDPFSPPSVTEFDQLRLASEGRAVPGEGRRIPSAGRPVPGIEIEIRDERDQPLEEGGVGRILVRGPSVTSEYFNDPESTRKVFRDGWLDTGDLGFFLKKELYISGRVKDLIIIRGKNFSPQEIEEVLAGVEGLRPGCSVAVSTAFEGEGEQLILLAERALNSQRPDQAITEEIAERVLSGVGLTPYHVQILDPGTLPRTSSGKMRRGAALQMFLSGQLAPPETSKLGFFKHLARSQAALLGFRLKKKRRT